MEKVSFVKAYPQWHWIVGTGVYNDKIEAELREKYWAIGAALLLAMAAMGIVGWRAVSAVTDPIGKAIELVEQMRGGDLRGSQHGVGGEIGTLLDTLNRSKAGIGALASEAHAKAASTRAAAEASARRAQSGSESASGLARALDEAARGRDRIRGGRDGARLWRGRPTGPAGHPSSRGRPTPSSKRWSPSSL